MTEISSAILYFMSESTSLAFHLFQTPYRNHCELYEGATRMTAQSSVILNFSCKEKYYMCISLV